MKGVGEAVSRGVPALGQPRLDFERRPVDPDQAPLQERIDRVAGLVTNNQSVEGAGLRPHRPDDLAAPAGRGPPGSARITRRVAEVVEKRGGDTGRKKDPEKSGRLHSVRSLPSGGLPSLTLLASQFLPPRPSS